MTNNKQGLRRNFLNVIKAIYEKPTANIILDNERPRIRQGCLFLPVLLNIVLEVPARAIRQEKTKDCRLKTLKQ